MVESRALYDLLENDIVPMFYTRGMDGVPRSWTTKMKAALGGLCPEFNTNRMVCDYVNHFYMPCAERHKRLVEDKCERAAALVEWQRRVSGEWHNVQIRSVHSSGAEEAKVGGELSVWCQVDLGGLQPGDVKVEAYYGRVGADGQICDPDTVGLRCEGEADQHVYLFKGAIQLSRSGRGGYAIRVMPQHADMCHPHATRLIHWAV